MDLERVERAEARADLMLKRWGDRTGPSERASRTAFALRWAYEGKDISVAPYQTASSRWPFRYWLSTIWPPHSNNTQPALHGGSWMSPGMSLVERDYLELGDRICGLIHSGLDEDPARVAYRRAIGWNLVTLMAGTELTAEHVWHPGWVDERST